MSHCHRSVVGTLLIWNGLIANAQRLKPPLKRAPSAGHFELGTGPDADGEAFTLELAILCAQRELREETGLYVDMDELKPMLTTWMDDSCAKPTSDGEPGGRHLWRIFTVELDGSAGRPELRDEPGKMTDWLWTPPDELIRNASTETIWRDFLRQIYS